MRQGRDKGRDKGRGRGEWNPIDFGGLKDKSNRTNRFNLKRDQRNKDKDRWREEY